MRIYIVMIEQGINRENQIFSIEILVYLRDLQKNGFLEYIK